MFWLSAAMIGSSEGRAAGPVKVDSRRRRRRWSAFAGLAAPSPHSAARHDLFTAPVLALERARKNLERCTKNHLQNGGESGPTLLHQRDRQRRAINGWEQLQQYPDK